MFDNMHAMVGVHYFTLHLQLCLKRHKVIGFPIFFCNFTSIINKNSAVNAAHRWTFADNVLPLRAKLLSNKKMCQQKELVEMWNVYMLKEKGQWVIGSWCMYPKQDHTLQQYSALLHLCTLLMQWSKWGHQWPSDPPTLKISPQLPNSFTGFRCNSVLASFLLLTIKSHHVLAPP